MNSLLLEIADALSALTDERSAVPARLDGAQAPSVLKRPLPELIAPEEPNAPIQNAPDLADAIAGIRAVASASPDPQVSRLLSEIVRQARVCGSRRALMAFVDDRLRRHVPLLAVTFATRRRTPTVPGECLSFELGHSGNSQVRMYVEFKPACPLDDAQVRLLHAAASVMSLIHGWHRTPDPAF